jgi:ABC-type multidrug transport system fused ATPase/permease subunit
MSSPATPVPAPLARTAVLQPGSGFIATFQALWPYLWPPERADLRQRVVAAFALLVIGRLVLMGVPFTFKWATDALANNPTTLSNWLPWLVGAPLALTVIYGFARVGSAAFVQLRDAIFAPVFMHAVRTLALQTFGHLHHLSLRFHLERKTGGLTRVLERGRNGIEEMVRLGLNQLVPVVIEVTLIIAVLLWLFDWRYVVVLVTMVVGYMAYTIKATEWRIAIRAEMNESDTDANAKAVDSLLNFETVKYFGAEQRESDRYERAVESYAKAAVKSENSLAWLNMGQSLITQCDARRG